MYSFKDNEKRAMLDEIAYFFKSEHDLDLGLIGTEIILDFFTKLMGDRIYNMALADAKQFFQKYAEHMDADFYTLYKSTK